MQGSWRFTPPRPAGHRCRAGPSAEAGGFPGADSRRERTSPVSIDDQDGLARGAAARRAQAAGQAVETHLGALDPVAGLGAHPPEDRADRRGRRTRPGRPSSRARCRGRHQVEQARCARPECQVTSAIGFQEGGEVGVAARRRGRGATRPSSRRARPAGGRGPGARRGFGRGCRRAQARRTARLAGGDHEDPGPRLRQERGGVDLQGAEDGSPRGQRLAQRGEIRTAVGGEQAADVLDDDEARGAASLAPGPPPAARSRRRPRTGRRPGPLARRPG
jgi:hypothetical protein